MPTICRYYPNRTHDRPFRATDVARIARYAAENDGKPKVIVRVLEELGYRRAVCVLLKLGKGLDTLEDSIGLAKVAAALATVLGGIIRVIKSSGPLARRFGYVVIALGVLQLFLKGLSELLDELEALDSALELLGVVCSESASPSESSARSRL